MTKANIILEKLAEYKLYFFEGRNTAVVAKSAKEAREKKRRGGDKIVKILKPSKEDLKKIKKGIWVRTRQDGLPPHKSKYGKGRGYGPPRIKTAEYENKGKFKEMLINAIAGGVAGAVSTAVTVPIDTIQILESTTKAPRKQIIRELYLEGKTNHKGLKGILKGIGRFYKGTGTKVLKVAPTMAISFPVFYYVVKKLHEKFK